MVNLPLIIFNFFINMFCQVCCYPAAPTTSYGSWQPHGTWTWHSQNRTSRPLFFQNGAKSGFEMFFGRNTSGAGAKIRLESRIKKFTPHCVCRYAMDLNHAGALNQALTAYEAILAGPGHGLPRGASVLAAQRACTRLSVRNPTGCIYYP